MPARPQLGVSVCKNNLKTSQTWLILAVSAAESSQDVYGRPPRSKGYIKMINTMNTNNIPNIWSYFIKLFTTYFITAWLAGSGAAGLSGLDGVSGLADRERHAYMDKKCDAYLFSSPQHRLQHRRRLQLKSTLLHSSKARAAVSTSPWHFS